MIASADALCLVFTMVCFCFRAACAADFCECHLMKIRSFFLLFVSHEV